MHIERDVILAPYTTFKIGGPAKFFSDVITIEDLSDSVAWARAQEVPMLILGGGSNVLVNDNGFPGLVIHFKNNGITIGDRTPVGIVINVAAGEVWDDVVKLAVQNGWWGIENLSHIPGQAGGFAVQNVGAYGQEASDVIVAVEALDMVEQRLRTFARDECSFSYRKSIFNAEEKGRFVILDMTLRLSLQPKPNLSYGAVNRYFAEKNISDPTQAQIRQAIIEIRDRQFPFPRSAINGNAGSFFRGHILTQPQIEYLFQKVATNFGQEKLEQLHGMSDRLMVAQGMKTPSAFLIELCGLKGKQIGGARVHDQHAAVIVNATGQSTAADVTELFRVVANRVYEQTGVILHIEPELVGYTEEEREVILESVTEK